MQYLYYFSLVFKVLELPNIERNMFDITQTIKIVKFLKCAYTFYI